MKIIKEFWNKYYNYIITGVLIFVGVILFIIAISWIAGRPYKETIYIYEISESKNGWTVIYEKYSTYNQWIRDIEFLTYEGAMKFIKENDKDFYNDLQ